MNTSISTAVSHPVIAGHEITTDEHGRFNLNAIHRASDTGQTKRPSIWRATKQAQELIGELEDQSQNSGFGPIEARHGGKSPGTFAHELLAISYAGWISPKFQLQVNQVFLDHRMGRLQQLEQQQALPNPLTPAHQREIQKAVARRCQSLPEAVRRNAYQSIYRHLKDRFEVGSYKDIDESRYTEALGAVQSFDLQGDFLARAEEAALALDADDLGNLRAMCVHAQWVRRQWEMQLRPALAMLSSPAARELDEHIGALMLLAQHLQRKAEALPEAA
ncbi:KilA-N domain-containing protein [uncultured Halomonas sp.]|uniref:KilA-N domain-containing protein n=1 Tax=uncultured Halomonas sp. TaxID=173971 RepID=UPI00260DC6D1|nr:KilA-N domain-containing protein [uncultured Halomonas sp.]